MSSDENSDRPQERGNDQKSENGPERSPTVVVIYGAGDF
jgi:hypothetical protein